MSRTKYGNQPTTVDNIRFDSKMEARYYEQVLKPLARAGAITDLEVDKRALRYELQPRFQDASGRTHRAITYEADARFVESGRVVLVDVKGAKTEAFKIKEKLFRYRYPDVELRIIEGGTR